MFSGKVYECRPFELTLYFSAVYGLNIVGTPTVIAEPEMFGNDGTLAVFQIIEGFAENLQPPSVIVYAVYVFDDKLVFTYNFKDGSQTITLDDIKVGEVVSTNKADTSFDVSAIFFLSRKGLENRLLAGLRGVPCSRRRPEPQRGRVRCSPPYPFSFCRLRKNRRTCLGTNRSFYSVLCFAQRRGRIKKNNADGFPRTQCGHAGSAR